MRRLAWAAAAGLLAACASNRPRSGAPASQPFLGVLFDEGAQQADRLYAGPGLLALEVFQDSPAGLAGLLPGDVLVRLGDQKIDSGLDFARGMAGAAPGDRVRLGVLRGGRSVQLEAILVPRRGLFKAIQPRDRPASPRRWVVSEDGADGALRTLAAAVYKSRAGDVIEVRPGEYGALHLLRDGVSIEGRPGAVVDALDGANQPSGVSVSGLAVRPAGGFHESQAARLSGATRVRLRDLSIGGARTGLFVSGSESVELSRLRLEGNVGAGLAVERSKAVVVSDSRIDDNAVGVESSEAELDLDRDTIVHNRRPIAAPGQPNAGVHFIRSTAKLSRSTVADNSRPGAPSVGVWIDGDKPVELSHDIVAGHAVGLRLAAGSNVAIKFDDVWGCPTPVAPPSAAPKEGLFFVDPAFADPEAGDYSVGAKPAAFKRPAPAAASSGKRKVRLEE